MLSPIDFTSPPLPSLLTSSVRYIMYRSLFYLFLPAARDTREGGQTCVKQSIESEKRRCSKNLQTRSSLLELHVTHLMRIPVTRSERIVRTTPSSHTLSLLSIQTSSCEQHVISFR